MADAIAFVDDIFFLAKMTETARHTGVELKTVADCDALLREAAANPGATLLLDLNARAGKPLEALARLRELDRAPSEASTSAQPASRAPGNDAPRRIIAFLSHVQIELADQARAAGCDEVMPRSKFTAELPRILRDARTENTQ
jgi:CheY-like chemotaxis protein